MDRVKQKISGAFDHNYGTSIVGAHIYGNINLAQAPSAVPRKSLKERRDECRRDLRSSNPNKDRTAIISTMDNKKFLQSCKYILDNLEYKKWIRPDSGSQLLWLHGVRGAGKTYGSVFLTEQHDESQDVINLYFFCLMTHDKRNTGACVLRGLIWLLVGARPHLADLILEDDTPNEILLKDIPSLWNLFEMMVKDPGTGPIHCVIDGLNECREDTMMALVRCIVNFIDKQRRIHVARSTGEQRTADAMSTACNPSLKMILVSRKEPQELSDVLLDFPFIPIGGRQTKGRLADLEKPSKRSSAIQSSHQRPMQSRPRMRLADAASKILQQQAVSRIDGEKTEVHHLDNQPTVSLLSSAHPNSHQVNSLSTSSQGVHSEAALVAICEQSPSVASQTLQPGAFKYCSSPGPQESSSQGLNALSPKTTSQPQDSGQALVLMRPTTHESTQTAHTATIDSKVYSTIDHASIAIDAASPIVADPTQDVPWISHDSSVLTTQAQAPESGPRKTESLLESDLGSSSACAVVPTTLTSPISPIDGQIAVCTSNPARTAHSNPSSPVELLGCTYFPPGAGAATMFDHSTCVYELPGAEWEMDIADASDDGPAETAEEAAYDRSISAYVDAKCEDLAAESTYTSDHISAIKRGLLTSGDGTFLWLDLAFAHLKATRVQDLETAIVHLPAGIDEIYCQILSQVPPHMASLVASMLQWIVAAKRPLSREELSVALGLPYTDSNNPNGLLNQSLAQCSSLVSVSSEDDSVSLGHATVGELLTGSSSKLLQDIGLSMYFVPLADVDRHIFQTCLNYLEGGCFADGAIETMEEGQTKYIARLNQFPFLAYAASFWFVHLQTASPVVINLHSPFFVTKSKVRKAWFQTYWTWNMQRGNFLAPRDFNLLHTAAYFDIMPLADVLRAYGQLYPRLEAKDSHGVTPLQHSIRSGNFAMFQFLVSQGAKTMAQGSDKGALEVACQAGQEDVVGYLLDHGHDVNTRYQAIHWSRVAMRVGRYTHGLLNDVAGMDEDLWTLWANADAGDDQRPIHKAAAHGHANILQLLMDRGADFSVSTTTGWTALHCAAFAGRLDCVQLLHEKGCNLMTATVKTRWLAIHAAAARGKVAVVRFMLEQQVPADSVTAKQKTAMHIAAKYDHSAVLSYLCESGAQLDARSHNGNTALHYAVIALKPLAAQTLLLAGANRLMVNNEGRTARQCLRSGSSPAAQELLRILDNCGLPGYIPYEDPANKTDVAASTSLQDKPANVIEERSGVLEVTAMAHLSISSTSGATAQISNPSIASNGLLTPAITPATQSAPASIPSDGSYFSQHMLKQPQASVPATPLSPPPPYQAYQQNFAAVQTPMANVTSSAAVYVHPEASVSFNTPGPWSSGIVVEKDLHAQTVYHAPTGTNLQQTHLSSAQSTQAHLNHVAPVYAQQPYSSSAAPYSDTFMHPATQMYATAPQYLTTSINMSAYGTQSAAYNLAPQLQSQSQMTTGVGMLAQQPDIATNGSSPMTPIQVSGTSAGGTEQVYQPVYNAHPTSHHPAQTLSPALIPQVQYSYAQPQPVTVNETPFTSPSQGQYQPPPYSVSPLTPMASHTPTLQNASSPWIPQPIIPHDTSLQAAHASTGPYFAPPPTTPQIQKKKSMLDGFFGS